MEEKGEGRWGKREGREKKGERVDMGEVGGGRIRKRGQSKKKNVCFYVELKNVILKFTINLLLKKVYSKFKPTSN